jgi:hypothetical protein
MADFVLYIFFCLFYKPLTCLCVPSGIRVPRVENHFSTAAFPKVSTTQKLLKFFISRETPTCEMLTEGDAFQVLRHYCKQCVYVVCVLPQTVQKNLTICTTFQQILSSYFDLLDTERAGNSCNNHMGQTSQQ